MARPRSAVYAVEGESRRPGIHFDRVSTATTCTRPSCGAHSGTRRAHRNDQRHLRWGSGRPTRSGLPREPGGGSATATSRG